MMAQHTGRSYHLKSCSCSNRTKHGMKCLCGWTNWVVADPYFDSGYDCDKGVHSPLSQEPLSANYLEFPILNC